MEEKIINIDPEIMGGEPVFMGTRVPITALFDYLEDNETLESFLDDFPSVRREQAIGLLKITQFDTLKNTFAKAA